MISSEKIMKLFSVLVVIGLVAVSCSSNTGPEEEEEPEPTTYDLTVSADPSEGGSVDPSSGTFDEGEEVEVTATAADGWEFSEWTGDIESADNPLTFTIEENTSLTAQFTEVDEEPTTYDLTVNTDPSEGGSVDPSSGTFDEGEEVEITATPADGWEFSGWSGDLESNDNPVTVTMDANTTITAEFSEVEEEPTTYDLTVNVDPSEGGSVDPESETVEEGEEIEVTATPAEGWEFTGWSGDVESGENPLTVTMDANTTITAEFSEVTHELTVNTDPSEGGSVDPSSGTFDEGEEVEVTATPAEGWEFTGWSGDVESSDNPVTVTMDTNTTITAEFSEIPTYELAVTADPSEGGSVSPSSGTYQEGEEVEITATANDDWFFVGWSGVDSDENPLTVTMDGDTEITANFEEDAKAYSNEIEVSDGTNSETLTFGMDAEATAGFDDGLDEEAPPAPPQGSFYGNFVIESYNLFKDFRPVSKDQTVWEINIDGEDDSSVTLSWDFSSSDHAGTLTLVDDPDNPSTVDIDMEAQSSYEADSSVETLYIIQE